MNRWFVFYGEGMVFGLCFDSETRVCVETSKGWEQMIGKTSKEMHTWRMENNAAIIALKPEHENYTIDWNF